MFPYVSSLGETNCQCSLAVDNVMFVTLMEFGLGMSSRKKIINRQLKERGIDRHI